MKNYIFLFGLFLAFQNANAQKYYTKAGQTHFKASVETFEPVEAENNSTTAILDTKTGQVAALMFIKSFHFKVALMEEHFNENYMDSDAFPKAKFQGEITNFSMGQIAKEEHSFELTGKLTIHGVTHDVIIPVLLKKVNSQILVTGQFTVKPEDYDIEIPSIVRSKIAKEIRIALNYTLNEKK